MIVCKLHRRAGRSRPRTRRPQETQRHNLTKPWARARGTSAPALAQDAALLDDDRELNEMPDTGEPRPLPRGAQPRWTRRAHVCYAKPSHET